MPAFTCPTVNRMPLVPRSTRCVNNSTCSPEKLRRLVTLPSFTITRRPGSSIFSRSPKSLRIPLKFSGSTVPCALGGSMWTSFPREAISPSIA